MPLPGKLCIGILEEDNPLKSYFCFKPILVEENGRYVPFEQFDAYADTGCIRIVPDKNESSHFKARMRRIGLFAVVDLREHPNENDKIRLNKNYHGDDSERNTHIIYSDVVCEPAPNMIFALLPMAPADAENAHLQDVPSTAKVLLRPDQAVEPGVWTYEVAEDHEDDIRLHSDPSEVCIEDLQIFDLNGFRDSRLSFAVLPPDKVDHVAEPALTKPPKAAPAEAVKEPEKPAAPVPAPAPAPAAEPVRESAPKAAEPAAEPAEKPWIQHSSLFVQPAIDPNLPLYQRILAVQSGLNPRRSRSLQEVIDDKWKHSRIEQLGHAVQELSTLSPVPNPVEQAIGSLQLAWSCREQREALTDAIIHMEGVEFALDARRAAIKDNAVNEQLTELEAQRLEMLDDIEQIKRKGADVRKMLKQEIYQDEAAAFSDAVSKTAQAKEECSRWQAEADQAKSVAESMEDALNSLSDGRFEKRLYEFAINSHAVELLRRMNNAEPPAPAVINGSSATAEELILRVRSCFTDAGFSISQTDAVNLLICAAQSPALIVSGAPGAGKSTYIRLLARALGIENNRFLRFAPGNEPLGGRAASLSEGNAVSIALLEDINLVRNEDPGRGLFAEAQQGKFLLCATVQDEGQPLPAHVLGRSFLLRLPEELPGSAWQPKEVSTPKTYSPISREALRTAFEPTLAGLPAHLIKRMNKLRADLAVLGVRLSRGTLNALWNYCAAAIPLMPVEPSTVLDMAVCQRALPLILASAPLDALAALPKILSDLPRSKALLEQPLPIDL